MTARITDEDARAVMASAGFEPLEPYPGNNVPWRCRCLTCGHESTPRYATARKGHRCAWCAGHRVDPREARDRMVAAGLEPLEDYPGATEPWRCRCAVCGREVSPSYSNIRRGFGGCGWCAGNRVDPEDAADVMVAAGLEPLEDYPGATEPWRCRCAVCGREVTPTYSHVRDRGRGCVWCAGKRVDPDEAAQFMFDSGFRPLAAYPGADTPWPCECVTCGREVAPTYTSTRNGHGCAWCAGQRISEDDAVATMRSVGLEPLEPYPGQSRQWSCRCSTCGRAVATWYSVAKRGGGCAWCAGNRIDASDAESVMRAANMEPLEPYPGALKPWRCHCRSCGRTISPRFANVQNGRGCRYCTSYGFDFAGRGFIYLLEHAEWSAAKVGVTTATARLDRVARHAEDGWRVVHSWEVNTGDQAIEVERAVLDWWRNTLEAPEALTSEEMPQGGWTETAPLALVDLDETIDRIQAEVDRLSD